MKKNKKKLVSWLKDVDLIFMKYKCSKCGAIKLDVEAVYMKVEDN